MSGMTRTFAAVGLPETHKTRLRQLEERLAPDAAGVRWVAPALCHLTLAFLGDVPNTDLDQVCRAVGEAAASIAAFELSLEGLGAFPNPSRPRVVWAGLTGAGLDGLRALQVAVVRALKAAGRPPVDERFSPHITIGRVKTGRGPAANLASLLQRHQDWSAGPFDVAEVVTFASILAPSGPTYTALAHNPLGAGNPPATA